MEGENAESVDPAGASIVCTTNHPFYVEGIGFVPAGDLQPGDSIMLLDGSSRKIESIEHEFPETSVKVYYFEVEDLHTYYVGVQGVLVHNICPRKGSNSSKPYTNSRPSFRKGVVEEVWENAKGPDGLVRDPNTGEIINWTPGESRKGVWDMGHIPEAKYSEMHEAYMNGEMTTKEFVDWYNALANYRPELPGNNRSRRFE